MPKRRSKQTRAFHGRFGQNSNISPVSSIVVDIAGANDHSSQSPDASKQVPDSEIDIFSLDEGSGAAEWPPRLGTESCSSAAESDVEAEMWTDDEIDSDPDWEVCYERLPRRTIDDQPMAAWETRMAGPKDKTGVRRDQYSLHGMSDQSFRRKKAKLGGELDESRQARDLERLHQLKAAHNSAVKAQTKLSFFIQRKRTHSPSQEDELQSKQARFGELEEVVWVDEDEGKELETTADEVALRKTPQLGGDNAAALARAEESEETDAVDDNDDEFKAIKVDFGRMLKEVTELWKKESKGKNLRDIRLLASLKEFYKVVAVTGRMKASLIVAKSVGRGLHNARCLSQHARFFEANHHLRPSVNGHRVTVNGLLDDEGVLLNVKKWLRKQPAGSVSPSRLAEYINLSILPQRNLRKLKLSMRQARRWLGQLGYFSKKHKKGVYWDGHERKDVIQQRKDYLSELLAVQKYSVQFEGKDLKPIQPKLKEGEKEHVILYHDECARHANEHPDNHWLKEDQQVLYKKDQGRLMMVSDFITEGTPSGRLVMDAAQRDKQMLLPETERLPSCSRQLIFPNNKPGGDAYWNMDQMIARMKSTIKLAEYLLPEKTLVFIFDNSSAHNSLAPDALHVKRMNINPGGKNVANMHDTMIPFDNPHGLGGQVQSMQYPEQFPAGDAREGLEGKPKGVAMVLLERGLIHRKGKAGYQTTTGKKVVGECKECKQAKARTQPKAGDTGNGVEEGSDDGSDSECEVGDGVETEDEDEDPDCCMRKMLSLQSDFRNENSMLYKIITAAGHKCIFLPKFHCELNPIEYYWAWVKERFRGRCNGNFATSKKLFEQVLDECPGDVIRRFVRRADRYASVYRLGATGLLAEYAVKKYKSHRYVSQRDLVEAEEEKAMKDAKKLKLTVK